MRAQARARKPTVLMLQQLRGAHVEILTLSGVNLGLGSNFDKVRHFCIRESGFICGSAKSTPIVGQ